MTSLSTELEMLLLSSILYFIQILVPALEADLRNGVAWGLGNRDTHPIGTAAWAERGTRAYNNMTENLIPFACLILIVQTSGNSGEMSALGAMVFFCSRLLHGIFYVAGITVLRSLAYFGSLAGMGMIIYQIL